MGQRRFASSVWPPHHRADARAPPKNNKKARVVPAKGYRKGIADNKRPRPCVIKARITTTAYKALQRDTELRSMTLSRLVDYIVEGYVTGTRATIPHRQSNAGALRELARIGNNLNQVAQQANVMNLHLIETEARRALAAVLDAVKRL